MLADEIGAIHPDFTDLAVAGGVVLYGAVMGWMGWMFGHLDRDERRANRANTARRVRQAAEIRDLTDGLDAFAPMPEPQPLYPDRPAQGGAHRVPEPALLKDEHTEHIPVRSEHATWLHPNIARRFREGGEQ